MKFVIIIAVLYLILNIFSCRSENQNLYLENKISQKLVQFDSQIEEIKKRNSDLVKIQKNEHLINYPYSTYMDSIRNIKITEMNQEIETIVSSHNESLFELIQRQKKAKQFFENIKENNPKNPSIDWDEQQDEIEKWLKHESMIDSVAKIWKNNLNDFIVNHNIDSTLSKNPPVFIPIPNQFTVPIQPPVN